MAPSGGTIAGIPPEFSTAYLPLSIFPFSASVWIPTCLFTRPASFHFPPSTCTPASCLVIPGRARFPSSALNALLCTQLSSKAFMSSPTVCLLRPTSFLNSSTSLLAYPRSAWQALNSSILRCNFSSTLLNFSLNCLFSSSSHSSQILLNFAEGHPAT